eukprot:TRINITY_DN2166_c0_g1_i3.p1 TRINITY_DN2166_c0_g1~~TRINITY_DN2166_c0_g1_i3.p1  ORF type:complete len:400 (+),score=98.77 TRINITY_DN2166_c0_g1_i3:2477-3676(+)
MTFSGTLRAYPGKKKPAVSDCHVVIVALIALQSWCAPCRKVIICSFLKSRQEMNSFTIRRLLEEESGDNVGLAFGLTIGAGACTLIGSAFVFLKKETVSKYIGPCLGIASGVIAWEGLVELYHEGQSRFGDYFGADSYKKSSFTALACWVGGWVTTALIGIIGKMVRKEPMDEEDSLILMAEDMAAVNKQDQINVVPNPEVPSDLDNASELVDQPKPDAAAPLEAVEIEQPKAQKKNNMNPTGMSKAELLETGILTAVIMFLHNVPEGLAVFLAALSGSGLGFGVAVAIALHNIPQGFAVALPIYEATGDRKKAFLWSFMSGLSQPLASLLGYFVLRDHMTDLVYGITFAYASGMMAYVCLKVLLPAAHKCDPRDKYVSWSVFFGAFIIGLSLSFFDEA